MRRRQPWRIVVGVVLLAGLVHGVAAAQEMPEPCQRGWELLRGGEGEEAIAAFKRGGEEVPCLLGLAAAYKKKNHLDGVRQMARRVMARSEESEVLEEAYNYLGFALVSLAQAREQEKVVFKLLEEAEEAFREAMALSREEVGLSHFNLAETLVIRCRLASKLRRRGCQSEWLEIASLMRRFLDAHPEGEQAARARYVLCGSNTCTPISLWEEDGAGVPSQLHPILSFDGGRRDSADSARIQPPGDVLPPRKVHEVVPSYPPLARSLRVQGVVILQAIIDREGTVTNVETLRALPFGLTEAAAEAIRQWEFEPATLDGKPVSVYYNLTVNFTLK